MPHREIPSFATEAEEAKWWYDNRDKDNQNFLQALREGRINRLTLEQRLDRARGTTSITIKPDDMRAASQLAEKQGLPVAEFLEALLHDALQQKLANAA